MSDIPHAFVSILSTFLLFRVSVSPAEGDVVISVFAINNFDAKKSTHFNQVCFSNRTRFKQSSTIVRIPKGYCLNLKVFRIFNLILPPANEVWAKVLFLQLCVILFTGRRWVCIHRGVSTSKGGVYFQGVSSSGGGGVGQAPPHRIIWDVVNKRVVRILLKCVLVPQIFCLINLIKRRKSQTSVKFSRAVIYC